MQSKDNRIDLECADIIIESIIYLLRYNSSFLKKAMPCFNDDNLIKNHSLHVAIYALAIANALKFRDDDLHKIGLAALLHDIGLKGIDENIINKKDILTQTETSIIQKHSRYGVEIAEHNKIHDPYIIDAIMHHHERYDGSGYPNQLTIDEISDFASILAICDVFDALTSNRPYREHFTSFNALKKMMKEEDMIKKFNQRYIHLFLKSFL
jgi:putative nucleotidyltransferase with HDIG domain